jgi:hypothetical protein|tara:strand:- start:1244 stop:2614 length:1371 start_codon:yes stop_codon:yes gene_type:complete
LKKIKNKIKYKNGQKRNFKRENKKRKRNKRYHGLYDLEPNYYNDIGLLKHEDKLIARKTFPLDNFLNKNGIGESESPSSEIVIPKHFVLEKFHSSSFKTITKIRQSITFFKGKSVTIDFTKCKEVDYSCIFLLLVILIEYTDFFEKLDNSLRIKKTRPDIYIKPSKFNDVNLRLMAGYLLPEAKATKAFFKPFSTLNFIRGQKTKKSYMENEKGPAATMIRNYINNNLKQHGFSLDTDNSAYLDGIISEILNNAEDHSEFDTWYVSGNIFQSENNNVDDDFVSEINLAFLNFGYSIYSGFENNKNLNKETYRQMEEMYEEVKTQMNGHNFFGKEEMFTLYALQEGISRLNYENEDRGTGTMKILKSFINLGDYVKEDKNIKPSLLVYSGDVFLKCDHKLRPKTIKGIDVMALNENNDLNLPPSNSHLKKLQNSFPGTFLVVKLYINKSHLERKIRK